MAPEAYKGFVHYALDYWSLGAMLYEMVCGKLRSSSSADDSMQPSQPARSESEEEIIAAVKQDPICIQTMGMFFLSLGVRRNCPFRLSIMTMPEKICRSEIAITKRWVLSLEKLM